MTLDFNTPVCQHFLHGYRAIPATLRLEHTKYGVTYYCEGHPLLIYLLVNDQDWTATPINQHAQPAQERG